MKTRESVPTKYQHTYEPACTKPVEMKDEGKPDWTEEPKYSGTITIEIPTYQQRLELAGIADIEQVEGESKEQMKERATEQAKSAGANFSARILRAKPFVLEVNLKRLRDNYVFDCLEDLERDSDMIQTLAEIVSKLCGNLNVGN